MVLWDGMVLRTSVIDFDPWYIAYTDSEGKSRMHGIFGSMIGNITRSLNMTYEMIPAPDGKYGMVLPDGTVNGALLQLEKGEIDLALGPFNPHWYLHKFFHVPQPPVYTYTTILSGMREAWIKKPAAFTQAFDAETWSYILLSAIAVIVLVLIYQKYVQATTIPLMERFSGEVFIALQTLLQESTKDRFHTNFTKFVGGTWIMGTFILCQMFTSQGKANLVVKSPTLRIDTVDMINQRPELTIIYPINTPIHFVLNNLPGQRGERFRAHMDSNGDGINAPYYGAAVQERLGNGRAVLIMDLQSIQKNVFGWCPRTKYYYYIGIENIGELPAFWVTSQNLPEGLNKIIDRKVGWIVAMDVPFMTSLELFGGNDECIAPRSRARSETAEPLSVQDVEFTFYAWLSGAAGSTIMVALELMYYLAMKLFCTSPNNAPSTIHYS